MLGCRWRVGGGREQEEEEGVEELGLDILGHGLLLGYSSFIVYHLSEDT
jgi:hypothetical protein